MKMSISGMAMLLLCVMAFPALAERMVEGRDYQTCTEQSYHGSGFQFKDCFLPGTPSIVSEKYTDQNGNMRVARVTSHFYVNCTSDRICSVFGSPDYVRGEYRGDADEGYYRLTHNFYIGEDYDGRPTAYLVGRGPKFGEDMAGGPLPGEVETPIAGGNWIYDEE